MCRLKTQISENMLPLVAVVAAVAESAEAVAY